MYIELSDDLDTDTIFKSLSNTEKRELLDLLLDDLDTDTIFQSLSNTEKKELLDLLLEDEEKKVC